MNRKKKYTQLVIYFRTAHEIAKNDNHNMLFKILSDKAFNFRLLFLSLVSHHYFDPSENDNFEDWDIQECCHAFGITGKFDMFKCFVDLGIVDDGWTIGHATLNGRVHFVKQSLAFNVPVAPEIIYEAVEGGHLESVRDLHNHGILISGATGTLNASDCFTK
jgi:hypothetical protein